MLTMVPSMMTSEMAIDIKTRPTQRFLTFDIQNSQTQLLGENLWVLQLPKALLRLYSYGWLDFIRRLEITPSKQTANIGF